MMVRWAVSSTKNVACAYGRLAINGPYTGSCASFGSAASAWLAGISPTCLSQVRWTSGDVRYFRNATAAVSRGPVALREIPLTQNEPKLLGAPPAVRRGRSATPHGNFAPDWMAPIANDPSTIIPAFPALNASRYPLPPGKKSMTPTLSLVTKSVYQARAAAP